MRRRAFTLIELLIVVAIIAILAAIAVPNFLEAQTRAKVSRVKNDMRTIATAMEAYLVDYNSYVNDSDNTPGIGNDQNGLIRLTTPVAYMTTLATDPFQAQIGNNTAQGGAKYYELGSGSDNLGWGDEAGKASPPEPPRINAWILTSVGPDFADHVSGNDEWPGGPGLTNPVTILTYDPTNGSISDGDIIRVGGTVGIGNYTINGRRLGPIGNE